MRFLLSTYVLILVSWTRADTEDGSSSQRLLVIPVDHPAAQQILHDEPYVRTIDLVELNPVNEDDPPAQPPQLVPAAQPVQQELAPQPVQQGFAPQPVQQELAPQPGQQGFAPQPVEQGFAPQPVQQGFAPQPVQQEFATQPVQSVPAAQPAQQELAPQPVQVVPQVQQPQRDPVSRPDAPPAAPSPVDYHTRRKYVLIGGKPYYYDQYFYYGLLG